MDKEFAYASVSKPSVSTGKLMDNSEWKYHIKQHLYDVREMIDNHIEQIHASVTENVKQTIKFIQNEQKSNKNLMKRPNGGKQMVKLDPSMFAIRQLWDQAATPDESLDSPLQIINVRQTEFNSRITKAEQKALQTVRLTKGEQIDNKNLLPSRQVVLVDTRIDRFKRQNRITVNETVFLLFLVYFTQIHFTCTGAAITDAHNLHNGTSQFYCLYKIQVARL